AALAPWSTTRPPAPGHELFETDPQRMGGIGDQIAELVDRARRRPLAPVDVLVRGALVSGMMPGMAPGADRLGALCTVQRRSVLCTARAAQPRRRQMAINRLDG